MNKLKSLDAKGMLFFNSRIKCAILDKIFPLLTHIGSAVTTIAICLLMMILGDEFVYSAGFAALISLAVSHLIVQGLKKTVRRKRPIDVLPEISTFKISFDRYSFPSGHTTAVFSIATTVSMYMPLLSFLLFPVAFLIGISRIYVGVHYPSDVLAGFIIAIATSVLLA